MTKLETAGVQVVDTADVTRVGTTWIAERIREAIAARGTASVALSGGNTPKPIYQALASLPIAWDRVHVFFADERCVPAEDPESNFRMVREALLDRVGTAHVHRMMGERADREAAAADYAKELPDALDLIVLGIGEDGHTASLFPGHDWSRQTGRKVIAVSGSPKPPPFRLSITPDVIWAARARLVLATGTGKARAVRDALQGDVLTSLHPVQTARDATWLLDRAAASLLAK